MKKILGLIPVRLKSRRLKNKALLKLRNIPLVMHVYFRAKLSKKLDDVIVCCDDKKIFDVVHNFGGKAILTSKLHKNGTERIAEVLNLKKTKYKLIIDIQGDEPFINPKQIDEVIKFHLNNYNTDIVVPSLKIKNNFNHNIVKIIKTLKDNVLYFSRENVPYGFYKKNSFLNKHLSIISFKPNALKKYAKFKHTPLEKLEGIELLRALEIGLKIKSPSIKGDNFSVDVHQDYMNAKKIINQDKIFKHYKNKFL